LALKFSLPVTEIGGLAHAEEVGKAKQLALLPLEPLNALKVAAFVGGVHDKVGALLLVDLALIDGLLERIRGNEAVDFDMPALPDTERPVLRLDIVGRIPVGIKHHDLIGSREVEP